MNKTDVYFKKAGELKFVPHAALINSELGSLDAIKASPAGAMVNSDNFAFGASGAGNNWTKAHCIEGTHLIDGVVGVIRKGTESGDRPQGFQITHWVVRGTDLALYSNFIINENKIYNYSHTFTATFSVYPSPTTIIIMTRQLYVQGWTQQTEMIVCWMLQFLMVFID